MKYLNYSILNAGNVDQDHVFQIWTKLCLCDAVQITKNPVIKYLKQTMAYKNERQQRQNTYYPKSKYRVVVYRDSIQDLPQTKPINAKSLDFEKYRICTNV